MRPRPIGSKRRSYLGIAVPTPHRSAPNDSGKKGRRNLEDKDANPFPIFSIYSFMTEIKLMSTEELQRWSPCTLAVTPLLAMLMLLSTGCSDQQSSTSQQTQSTETPAAQVAEPESMPAASMSEPAAEAGETAAVAAAGDGEAVYQKACKNCHATGVANAPKFGDSQAWAPRIAKGRDALFGSVKNGLNVMPPKGGCMTCSDEELRNAVEYMVSHGS